MQHPDGVGSLVAKLLHGEVGEVSVDAAGLVEDFGIVGIGPVQGKRGLDGVGVAVERGVGTEEFEAALALDLGLG